MKYFSPSVLDGSITTAKLADDAVTEAKIVDRAVTRAKVGLLAVGSAEIGALAVTRGKLDTVTDSQAGSILASALVTVSLDPYSFFPDIEVAIASDIQPVVATGIAIPAASADAPQFRLENTVGTARNYSVAWRRVDP